MLKRIIAITICLIMAMTNLVYSQASTGNSMEAPENLTVELKMHQDGSAYFQLNFDVPSSVRELAKESSSYADLLYAVEYKIGDGDWKPIKTVHYTIGEQIDITDPDNIIDIKANSYYFRVRFEFYIITESNPPPNVSPYSNIASIGVDAKQNPYEGASTWAVPELDKSAEYGFITEKIRNMMNASITREELCEVIMRLYEKMAGQTTYNDMGVFTDTQNPDVFKAYELGIVGGVGDNKFAPQDFANREQVAKMIYYAIKAIKPNTDFSINGAEEFTDDELISSWAMEPVKFLNKNGLLKGSDGKIDPKGITSREQAVLMIVRAYEKFQ